MAIAGILFDWRGTLVVPPTLEEWVSDGLRRVGRAHEERHVEELAVRITASNGVDDRMDAPGIDADASLHRRIFMDVLSDAGIDAPLADALYASESDYTRNPFATDAASTLRALKKAGLRIGVVSDIHFDIRPAFADAGLADMIDSYALSFEVGSQKPEAPIFTHALDHLGLEAAEVAMVGDRSRPDGGAVELGIVTLLLPPLRSPDDERLDAVIKLAL